MATEEIERMVVAMVMNRRSLKRGRSRPATQNRTTKQAVVVSTLSDEAIEALQIVRIMTLTSMVKQKRKDGSTHPEIRGFDDQGSAFLSDKTGLPKKKCFSRPEHIEAIFELYRTIPTQFQPKKWAAILGTK